ncbi:MAG TPA: 50S ribosomal protein L32 [Planctomycetota bacterium]|nr:50S ribosomal protein L32 [Planctomycetota bacterium]
MPNPKRRHSKSRKRWRRAHDALRAPGLRKCPRCSQAAFPHAVCGNCGFYRGVEVVPKEEE